MIDVLVFVENLGVVLCGDGGYGDFVGMVVVCV